MIPGSRLAIRAERSNHVFDLFRFFPLRPRRGGWRRYGETAPGPTFARQRWQWAISRVRRRVHRRRRLQDLRGLALTLLAFNLSGLIFAFAISRAEGKGIGERFVGAEPFLRTHPEWYRAWVASGYAGSMAAHRIGFGDVVPETTAGRIVTIICVTCSIVFNIVLITR